MNIFLHPRLTLDFFHEAIGVASLDYTYFRIFALLNAIANTLSLFESNVHLYYQKDRKQIIHEPIF